MLEPSYWKRKTYKLTIKLKDGKKGHFWTKPIRLDYEGIIRHVEWLERSMIEYRYMYIGLVWTSIVLLD